MRRQGKAAKRAQANVAKGRTKDSIKAFGKLTEDGRRRAPDRRRPAADRADRGSPRRARAPIEEFLRGVVRSYRRTLAGDRRKLLERFRYVHAARKVVGVGSVGTRAWICLLLGRDGDDPLFLQFKEAQPSVLEPFLGHSEFANSGQRVVEGQRLTQAASDIMLGWIKVDGPGRRQARLLHPPAVGREDVGARRRSWSRARWSFYARACGTELARAHTRGRRRNRDRELPR